MTLFTNAKLFLGTGPEPAPWEAEGRASAFTVADGRFGWVGPADQAPADADVVDLGGARVLPGLLDVHTHPVFMAVLADSTNLLPPACRSKADVLEALRAHPNLGQGPDAWILGFGYNEDIYPDGGPLRDDLDAISSTQPVFLRRADGHNAVVNSVALALAGIDESTPDPEGARYGRDENGRLDGRLVEWNAIESVAQHQPQLTASDLADRLVGMNDHFLGFGLVAVDDLLATFAPEPIEVYRLAVERGYALDTAIFLGWDRAGLPTLTEADRTGRVRIGGVKLFQDGAFSSRTAWVEEPYPHSCDHGMQTATDDDLRGGVAWARANGVQAAIHVMGDRGINHLLDLFADEEPWLEGKPSIVLEHSSIFTPAMLERVREARMSFALVTHTIFFFAEWDSYKVNLNPGVFVHAYPVRDMIDAGVEVALSSDSPATAWVDADNPFTSVYAAVERRSYDGSDINAAQAVSVGEALELYSGRAARITTNEVTGTITEGGDATFVVLSQDPFEIPRAELADVQVTETWLRGERVFQRR